MVPEHYKLLFCTAKHRSSKQLIGVLDRKIRNNIVHHVPIDFDSKYESKIPSQLSCQVTPIYENLSRLRDSISSAKQREYQSLVADTIDGKITYQNRTVSFEDAQIDWNWESISVENAALWLGKLHAYEPCYWLSVGFTEQSDVTTAFKSLQMDWITDWKETHPIGNKNYLRRAWTPYSVTLRILNWSRYIAWCAEHECQIPKPLIRELYKNAMFLRNHIETDVDGNHLLKNGAALVVAGILFESHDTDWIKTGIEILCHGANTQFLSDGYHFERSPMYHILVLKRYLTVVDLLRSIGSTYPSELDDVCQNGVSFLAQLKTPDNLIPLFNDSVFNVSHGLSLLECLQYADSIGFTPEPTNFGGSTYKWISSDSYTVLADVGPIGPSKLPAHAHNDLFSYILWKDNTRIVTDTGVYDYAGNHTRQYSRGVQGHNTIQVDSVQPLDIGDSFLVGCGINKINPSNTVVYNEDSGISSQYSITKKDVAYEHHRTIRAKDNEIEVTDKVVSNKPSVVENRIHIHPDVEVTYKNKKAKIVTLNYATGRCYLSCDVGEINIENTEYYPEFGTTLPRSTIKLSSTDSMKSTMKYIFSENPCLVV